MKTQSYLFGILTILIATAAIGAAAYLAMTQKPKMVVTPPPPIPVTATEPTPTPPEVPITLTQSTSSFVILPTVSSPLPNSEVKSPLTVLGSATGNWYFEASFPVVLMDSNGDILAQAPATAQGDWMTTSTVPYLATLSWASTTATSGILILKKDNPSGLPENDREMRIPVKF